MVQITQISHDFNGPSGKIYALNNINLTVGQGEIAAIQGKSGSGKSTLLFIAGGLLCPRSGTITVDNTDIYHLDNSGRNSFRAGKIGFVFQQFHLLPFLNAESNVLTAALAIDSDKKKARHAARQILESVGLADRLHHHPSQLSAGEQQRVALARALINKPLVILADEPTGNLDDSNATIVISTLRDFAAAGGTVLLVTHDITVAQKADRRILIDKGTVTAES